MSYYLSAYLVDLEQLRSAYGSNRTDLVLDIERSLSEKIRKLNDSLQDEWDIEVPTINEVLHSNIAGEFPWPYQEAPYKDVLKLLCSYFGDTLPNDVFNG